MAKGKAKRREMTLYCAICNESFDYDRVFLIHKGSIKTLFHTTCSKCKTSTIVMVSENQRGIMGVGMLTDLDREEVTEKIKSEAISADEIIETYKVLNI